MKKKTIPTTNDALNFMEAPDPFQATAEEEAGVEANTSTSIAMVIPEKSELRKSAHINLRILPKLKKDLASAAAEKGLTVSDLLTVMIQSVVSNREFKM